ncbi:hypothetical protein HK101_008299 [Irineochytrium annulatum]|nr:hypothetical protein HK101_008299 [Irineochytrium annulatum]
MAAAGYDCDRLATLAPHALVVQLLEEFDVRTVCVGKALLMDATGHDPIKFIQERYKDDVEWLRGVDPDLHRAVLRLQALGHTPADIYTPYILCCIRKSFASELLDPVFEQTVSGSEAGRVYLLPMSTANKLPVLRPFQRKPILRSHEQVFAWIQMRKNHYVGLEVNLISHR